MKRSELENVKEKALTQRGESADMRLVCEKLRELPKGQLKKVLTQEVLEIFAKYGVKM